MLSNKLLTNADREYYQSTIDLMWKICPETMSKKFPRANVQQAWMIHAVLDAYDLIGDDPDEILCVGSHEDTASEFLNSLYDFNEPTKIHEIDPVYDWTLHEYRESVSHPSSYNIIFSTSVIEHVENDEEFVDDMCYLLRPGGYGLLTCDFNNDWIPGQKLPYTDVRFYTEYDLTIRLFQILKKNNCNLVGEVDYSGNLDFEYDGCRYSFATYCFKKEK